MGYVILEEDMGTEYIEGVGHVRAFHVEGVRNGMLAKAAAVGLGIDWESGKWDRSVGKWKCCHSPAGKKVILYAHPVYKRRKGCPWLGPRVIRSHEIWLTVKPFVMDEAGEKVVEGGRVTVGENPERALELARYAGYTGGRGITTVKTPSSCLATVNNCALV